MTFIPEINTGSQLFISFYERNTFYTPYFSFGKFIYWMLLAAIGFTFVVVVNLGNKRRTPFTSRDGSFKDIKILMKVAPILFFFAPIIFIRDTYDMQRNCPVINQDFIQNSYEDGYFVNGIGYKDIKASPEIPHSHIHSPSKIDLNYMDIEENLENLEFEHCHTFTRSEVFWYNFIHLIFYFIGLNFTHADVGILQDFTLDWEVMKNWPPILWVIFVGLVAFLIFTVSHLFMLYYQSNVLPFYGILLTLYIGFFVIKTWLLRGKKELHIHHYVLGFTVVLLCGYQSYFVTILAAVFTGIFVEGASRWGFDPIWVDP